LLFSIKKRVLKDLSSQITITLNLIADKSSSLELLNFLLNICSLPPQFDLPFKIFIICLAFSRFDKGCKRINSQKTQTSNLIAEASSLPDI
jgi:hypothetical protein